ncbi:hypothetical protein P4S65_10285 [Pseudoalteromonas sp. B131b]|uniref:hypothetical protein n=1 Tax=Pseudoalteromonas sp. B131b TaxID=630493 RepID=UPI00301E17B4
MLLKGSKFLEEVDLKNIQEELDFCTPVEFKKLMKRMEKNSFEIEFIGNKLIQVARS